MNEISEKSQDVFRSYFHGNDIAIVAPLNWGLVTPQCIPVIHWLIQHCAQVIIASDGESLELLKKEFPQLTFESCPGYNIRYKYENILVNMLMALPTMIRAVNREKAIVKSLSQKYNANVILSDNRLGRRTNKHGTTISLININILHPNKLIASLGLPSTNGLSKNLILVLCPINEGKRQFVRHCHPVRI